MHQVQPNVHRYAGMGTRSTCTKIDLLTPCSSSSMGFAHQRAMQSNGRGNSDSTLCVPSSTNSSPGLTNDGSTTVLSTSAPKRTTTGSIFETLMPARRASVAWVPDSLAEKCYHCHVYFSLVVRRHHCRRCGNVFCDSCTSSRMPVVSQGFFTPVRVCEKCFKAAKRARPRIRNTRNEGNDEPADYGSSFDNGPTQQQGQELHDQLLREQQQDQCAISSSFNEASSRSQAPFRRSRTADDDTFGEDPEQDQLHEFMPGQYHVHSHCEMSHNSSLWSDQDSEDLLGSPTSKFRLKTLPGEVVMVRTENVRISFMERTQHTGTLCSTNFRLVFNPDAPDLISAAGGLDLNLCLHPNGVKEDELPYESDWDEPLNAYQAITLVSIERAKRKEVVESDMGVIDLVCKDFRHVQFFFDGLVGLQSFSQFDATYNLIRQYAFGEPAGPMAEFAKFSMEKYDLVRDGWKEYDPVEEFNRMGVTHQNKWRISRLNQNYEMCPSYPALLAVPSNVSDHVLAQASKFRSKGRIPVLSWRDPRSGAVMCRSSQPLVGLGHKQCDRDVFLVQAIAASNFSSSRVVIIDARPWRNAVAQKTMARAGYELTARYETRHLNASLKYADMDLSGQRALLRSQLGEMDPSASIVGQTSDSLSIRSVESSVVTECKLVFMGIENIHVMRKSYNKLLDLCISKSNSSSSEKWLEQLASTRWMEFLSRIIGSAVDIVRIIRDQKASVLVHCSDGWDRTTQLVSLAQVLLDPFYRTIHGFQVLIEKEWCSFGHKFRDRTGHGLSNSSSEIAPVFLQWIDCIWQCQKQFPSAFEFNERYLIFVLDHLYSCRFGTFLYDSEQERRQQEAKRPTVSLWTFLNAMDRSVVVNPFYHAYEAPRKKWKASVTARRHCFEIPSQHTDSTQPQPCSRWNVNMRGSGGEEGENDSGAASGSSGASAGLRDRSMYPTSASSLASGVSESELSSCQSSPRGPSGNGESEMAVGADVETIFDLEPVDQAHEEGFQQQTGDSLALNLMDEEEEEGHSSSCFHRIVRDLDSGLSFPQPVESSATGKAPQKVMLSRLVSAPATTASSQAPAKPTEVPNTAAEKDAGDTGSKDLAAPPPVKTPPKSDDLLLRSRKTPSFTNVPSVLDRPTLKRRCSCPVLSLNAVSLNDHVRRSSCSDDQDPPTGESSLEDEMTASNNSINNPNVNNNHDRSHSNSSGNSTGDGQVLFPSHSLKILRFWTSYYLRWDCSSRNERDANVEIEISHRDVLSQLQRAKEKLETVQQLVATQVPSPLLRGVLSSPVMSPTSPFGRVPAAFSLALDTAVTKETEDVGRKEDQQMRLLLERQNQRLECCLMSYEDQFSRVLLG